MPSSDRTAAEAMPGIIAATNSATPLKTNDRFITTLIMRTLRLLRRMCFATAPIEYTSNSRKCSFWNLLQLIAKFKSIKKDLSKQFLFKQLYWRHAHGDRARQ